MPVITLTTDLGTVDYYVSAVKASILRQLDNVNIIDTAINREVISTFSWDHMWKKVFLMVILNHENGGTTV